MAKRVTPEEVKEFVRLYQLYGTYAEVARRTKRNAQTVKRYVTANGLKPLAMAASQEMK